MFKVFNKNPLSSLALSFLQRRMRNLRRSNPDQDREKERAQK